MVKKAMSKSGLIYFSSLTPKQKDRSVFVCKLIKLGLYGLNEGLAKMLVAASDCKIDLNGCKMFYSELAKCWLPIGDYISRLNNKGNEGK